MVERARRVVAVCDSSKFGHRSLSHIVPTKAIHHVITDKRIVKSDLQALKDLGIAVTLV
jgi:DeoR family transcriptional regulator of aga operon